MLQACPLLPLMKSTRAASLPAAHSCIVDDPNIYYEAPDQEWPSSPTEHKNTAGTTGGDGGESTSDSDNESHSSSRKLRMRRQRIGMSERWVPFKQTNGVAIYHHDQPDDGSGIGG